MSDSLKPTQDQNANSFTVIMNDDVSLFLDKQGITDPSSYFNGLLRREMESCRGNERHPSVDERNAIADNAPDTSGNNVARDHFAVGGI